MSDNKVPIYEAVVEYDDTGKSFFEQMSGVYDPVVRIVIETSFSSYELDPGKLRTLTVRRK